jgi:hypothetical protein
MKINMSFFIDLLQAAAFIVIVYVVSAGALWAIRRL